MCSFAQAELTPVRLQLKWDHEFQFAGFYAAKWQGFYEDAGLDVSFVARPNADGSLKDINQEVLQGRAHFAVGGPDILREIDLGHEFVLLSSLFQRSPFSYSVLESSPIKSLKDIYESCIGDSGDSGDFGSFELKTVFLKEGFDLKKLNLQDYSYALSDVISGKCAVSIDYRIAVQWAAHEKNVKIRQFTAEQYGINVYGDILFTSRKLTLDQPDLVERFRLASLKGWLYALKHNEEVSKKIFETFDRVYKYDNIYEYNLMSSNIIKDLMNYPVTQIGHTNIERWEAMQNSLVDLGLVKRSKLPEWFLFDFKKIEKNKQLHNFYMLGVVLFIIVLLWGRYVYLLRRKEGQRYDLMRKNSELIKSSEILKGVLNLVPVAVFWKDKNSRFMGCNQKFLDDNGLVYENELVGKLDSQLPWFEKAEQFIESDKKIMGSNRLSFDDEEREITLAGVKTWIKLGRAQLRDLDGNVAGVLRMYQNISETKKSFYEITRQKNQSERLYLRMRSLIDSSPDMMFYKDYRETQGEYQVCNQYFEEWVGKTEQDIIGNTDENLFSESIAVQYREEDKGIILSHELLRKEVNIHLASGRRVLYDFVKIPVISNGRVEGILGVAKDITSRRELEYIYETIFSISNDAYFILDEKGEIANCNQAALDYLKVDHKATLIGMRPIRDFSPDLQPSGVRSMEKSREINDLLNDPEKTHLSFQWVHQDINGKPLYVDVFLAKLSGVNKGRLLSVWHDVSESLARQQQLEKAKKEAEELVSMKSLFLANMSHEIRTPLNAVVGLGRMLEKPITDEKRKMYVENINKSSQHLLNVINDILDYSKLEANKVELEYKSVDVGLILNEVIGLYSQQAINKNIALTLVDNVNEMIVELDETRLKQVLTNLLSNAIKFTQTGGVKLAANLENLLLTISVTDTGMGIDSAAFERLFNPFTQADVTTTRQYGGTGLGLSICQSLSKLMGGSIEIESELGVGTCFSVLIPVRKAKIDKVQSGILEDDLNLSHKTILVVEDNALNQLVVLELLEDTGAKLLLANDGKEAIAMFTKHSVDLVLMDIQMPIMDGYSATQYIRQQLKLTLPIVALTANTGEDEKQKALTCGMDDYLTKPIDYSVLMKLLSRFLLDG